MNAIRTLALTFAAILPFALPAEGQVDARVWIENDRSYFDRGDVLDVNFLVTDDSYVAVVHIDTDGNMEFVFPQSPWDNEYVRGGRINRVSSRGRSGGWNVRSRAGIGYFYMVASPTPLDFSAFRGRTGSPWDWGYAGRAIHGDPFLAFDQIARVLVPRWGNSRYIYDYYSYHVGGLHRYPSYACSGGRYDSGWGWSPNYGSCSDLDYFLRDYPYYYDTRRYQGDRRVYLRDYDRLDPRYGYKEDPERDFGRTAVPRGSVSPDRSDRANDRYAEPRRDAAIPSSGGWSGTDRSVAPSDDRGAVGGSSREPSAGSTARPRPTIDQSRRPAQDDGADSRQPARGRP